MPKNMPEAKGLSEMQRTVYRAILTWIEREQHTPSMQEIATEAGTSKSTAHVVVRALVEAGLLEQRGASGMVRPTKWRIVLRKVTA